MLDKTSEKVLKLLIDRANKNQYGEANLDISDAEQFNLSWFRLRTIVDELKYNGMIYRCSPHDKDYRIWLTQSAYSYSKFKRSELLRFWTPIFISNLLSIAALIVAILAYIKQ